MRELYSLISMISFAPGSSRDSDASFSIALGGHPLCLFLNILPPRAYSSANIVSLYFLAVSSSLERPGHTSD